MLKSSVGLFRNALNMHDAACKMQNAGCWILAPIVKPALFRYLGPRCRPIIRTLSGLPYGDFLSTTQHEQALCIIELAPSAKQGRAEEATRLGFT